ncbi:MAG: hypothetical protein ACTHN5_21710 [Phycisphaerae bacterium]
MASIGLESHEGTWKIEGGDLEMAMQDGRPETVSETHHVDLDGERLVMHDEQEMVFHRIN